MVSSTARRGAWRASPLGVAAVSLALALSTGAPACTDAGLQAVPPPPPPKLDNLLTVRGEFCTEPAQQVVFPVKILMLLDQSASLQCTDQYNRRFDALNQFVNDLSPQPNIYFGFVGFSSWSREQPFTRNAADYQDFLDPGQGLGPATDYQGALATAIRIIEQDMVAVGAGERARTKYVVILMSDGSPEPRCNAGCEDDDTACTDGEDNDGDGLLDGSDPDCVGVDDNATHPDSLYPVCNTDLEITDGTYVDMQGLCPEYNQPPQVLQRVSEVIQLKDTYSAGDVRLHTVLLFSPQELVDARCGGAAAATFGYSHDVAQAMMQQMAIAGGGQFRDVNLEYQGDRFLDFDFQSLQSEQWLTEFTAINLNAHQLAGVYELDTDRDGLADSVEAQLKTDHRKADSDAPAGDGFGDLVEQRMASYGFDALDPTLPAIACLDTDDLDGDRLLNCEEAALGTDPRIPDTDGDGILDWMELLVGLDPLIPDGLEDFDFDGVLNQDEVRGGTDPLVPDDTVYRSSRVRYGLVDLGLDDVPDPGGGLRERHCYMFEVDQVRLVTPLTVTDRGNNRVYVYTLEKPVQVAGAEARAHVACVEAYYNGDTDKDPPDGIIDITTAFWEDQRGRLTAAIDAFKGCLGQSASWAGATGDDVRRDDLMTVSGRCMPRKVQIGDIVHQRDDLEDLVRSYVSNGLGPRFPAQAFHVFRPTENFNPSSDCVRPRELQRMSDYLQMLTEACAPCLDPTPPPPPAAETGG